MSLGCSAERRVEVLPEEGSLCIDFGEAAPEALERVLRVECLLQRGVWRCVAALWSSAGVASGVLRVVEQAWACDEHAGVWVVGRGVHVCCSGVGF